jgi:hypothetical protein|tara:strand:+ start:97 stop:591 length:495 start_codon:yes stop_codon:yes gene_type:complete
MTPEQKFQNLFEEMYNLCQENNWGDPFSYARSREIYMATVLGHKVAETFSGADGIDEVGECEYKSTTGKNVNGTYNGISVQDTWEEQEDYILNRKIGKYENHYFARFDGGTIAEIWKVDGKDVVNCLLPKIQDKFEKGTKGKSDPRIGVSIPKRDITKYGERIK